jgi:hypothetical protein
MTVDFAEDQLRQGAGMMAREPFPKAKAVAERLREQLANLPAESKQGRRRSNRLSRWDLLMFELIGKELDQLDKGARLDSPRTPYRETARRIAAKVLDLPEHAIRRRMR